MINGLNEYTRALLKTSDFLNSIQEMKAEKGKSRLFGDCIRHLTAGEIEILKAQGNRSRDWKTIWVVKEFIPDFVVNTTFIGKCVLGFFSGAETNVDSSTRLPSGITQSTIINSEIGNDSLVYGVGLLSNYVVKPKAVVYHVHAVIAAGPCTFGNGLEISFGIETGGREIASYAEMTIPVATAVATQRKNKAFLKTYAEFVKSYTALCTIPFGLIENESVVRYTTKVMDTYIGKSVTVDGATLVKNCTIFGTPEESTEIKDGAYVCDSCIQWGCEVSSMAIVENSILTEHSHVARHGKVKHSIIGPNSVVAEGEITSCLVGPFVGFHHQALLIAAMWPEGKGNVGYGANVGSNHTSKCSDQEIWCGEGTFFGLGVNIKFPSDFSEAPYSIVATAVDALPQKVEFPFSLINTPSRVLTELSPAYNEIVPGWVLSDNMYMVKRNEAKYKTRNKARRTEMVFDVFRRDIMDKVIRARNRLRDVHTIQDFYTEREIAGLGKNYMTEKNRMKGTETYTFYIEYYILCGLMQQVVTLLHTGQRDKIDTIYGDATDDPNWEHRRKLLKIENLDNRCVHANLKRLIVLQEKIAQDTQKAKEKDDIRGSQIIGDYPQVHTGASEDAFVKEVWEETKKANAEITKLISRLSDD